MRQLKEAYQKPQSIKCSFFSEKAFFFQGDGLSFVKAQHFNGYPDKHFKTISDLKHFLLSFLLFVKYLPQKLPFPKIYRIINYYAFYF